MFCNQCGNKLPDDVKVCDKCGAKTINWKEEEVCCEDAITEEKVEKPKKKGMWLLWCVLAVIAVVIAYFALNICISHEWQDATCVAPRTCIKCERTEGEALGHKWQDANCVDAKKCSVCGETEGEALGHTFMDATCTEPMRCTVCDYREGMPNGHDWKNATCTQPKTCNTCGETQGSTAKHNFVNGGCNVCGKLNTVELTLSNYQDYITISCETVYNKTFNGIWNTSDVANTIMITITPKKEGYILDTLELSYNFTIDKNGVEEITKTKTHKFTNNALVCYITYNHTSYLGSIFYKTAHFESLSGAYVVTE